MTSSPPMSKEVVVGAFVLVIVVMVISSPDSDVCNLRRMFNSREQSATFLAKPFWDKEEIVSGEEETVFIRRTSCPVRVRGREVEDEAKSGVYSQSLRNGSEKDSSEKKHGGLGGQRKLKGSKRKRKQEKRKRFRKKKQKKS